jgi:eukaryotic-like serine/threonine-protein kinase
VNERVSPQDQDLPADSDADSFLKEVARAPRAFTLPSPGQLVGGKYRIEHLLGKGAMGAVFVAHQELLQQRVALKVMLPEAAASEQAAARFLNEARAASKIEGEHVARVFDVGQLETGAPFIALELLDGSDLAKVLLARRRISVSEAVDYVLQALEALAQAHVLGIVHRDLKPANLFLAQRRDGSRVVKVLDFGISKVIAPETGGAPNVLTASTSVLGSPLYMAPEQVRRSKSVDARADVWAVGVILFELLAGQPPFDAENVADVFVAILHQAPRPLHLLRPDLPDGIEAVVMRCLAKDASQRFGNVSELAAALSPFGPPHAQMSVDRIVRTVAGAPRIQTLLAPEHPVYAARHVTTSGATHAPPSPDPKVRALRVPWVLVATLLVAGLGSVGVAHFIDGHHAKLGLVDTQAVARPSTPIPANSLPVEPAPTGAALGLEAGPSPSFVASTQPSSSAAPRRHRVAPPAPAPDPFDTPR